MTPGLSCPHILGLWEPQAWPKTQANPGGMFIMILTTSSSAHDDQAGNTFNSCPQRLSAPHPTSGGSETPLPPRAAPRV